MKIRTKLLITFLTITVVPIFLIYISILGLSSYQNRVFRETYDVGQVDLSAGASIRVFSHLTESIQKEIEEKIAKDPEIFTDQSYLGDLNARMTEKHSFLMVTKDGKLIYIGNDETASSLEREISDYAEINDSDSWGNYLDKNTEHLIKQREFELADGSRIAVYLVTNVVDVIPEVKSMITEMFFSSVLILFITGGMLTAWGYRSILWPIGKLQEATKQIRDGNLDFTLDVEDDDEIGQLCQNFEEMRIRLKESTEEKIQYDKESKELISNISHDLKTPITAIKGYAEGLMEGVASSPEKRDKYIRTIYNKANDMDRLINELTFYSKIDTNKIPYTFSKINVANYFRDCVEEVGLELEARGIELGYFNFVDEDVMVIADAEQMKRVINNIIGNSLKYMDKKNGIINIRILDVGDFVQVEIEDNGKGIGQKELPYIFDRFYRTDSSRNSSKGGSGIGLSIVKKIIEDHGGKIWATSKLGIGTEIHFVLRKIAGDTQQYNIIPITGGTYMSKILIVEDEESIAELEKDYLELSGFEVEIENDGEAGLKRAISEEFDLFILDLMLPGVDGFEICKKIRETKNTPVIMISAKKDDIDKIRGLGLGADDYITKPFSPSEMVARVKAHLSRYERLIGSGTPVNDIIEIRGLKIDKTARRVYVNGEEKNFTTKEFDLLAFLAQNPNHVFTKEELFSKIWDMESIGDIATVTVHIKKIREKIEMNTAKPQYIETIWGVGYRFKV